MLYQHSFSSIARVARGVEAKKIPLVIYLHPTIFTFFNRATNFKFNQTCTLSVS
jgi:hypothetical protein